MRLWGLYLIPRDKAPDEGFQLLKTRGKRPWSAFRLPQPSTHMDGTPVSMNDTVDSLTEWLMAIERNREALDK